MQSSIAMQQSCTLGEGNRITTTICSSAAELYSWAKEKEEEEQEEVEEEEQEEVEEEDEHRTTIHSSIAMQQSCTHQPRQWFFF